MGLRERLIKILGGELRDLENVSSTDNAGMSEIFNIPRSNSGVIVTEESAMRLTAVYACVRILSESIASLPLKIYKRKADGSKDVAYNHPLYQVLHNITNQNQTSFEYRETIVSHLNLWGKAYSRKIFNNKGELIGLEALEPWKVTVLEDKNKPKHLQKRYFYYSDTGVQVYFEDEIFHIKGLSLNGKEGLSPIAYTREAIGLGLAAEEFGSRYFGQGTNLGGALEHPGTLSDDAYKRLKKDMAEKHQGLGNSHGIMILEEGMKLAKTVISPEDSQFIETRKFQLNEIARIFRVPPHMIADLEKATFSNIEHQGIQFVVHTLRPWLIRIEQAIYKQLLSPKEQKEYFAEFNVDGLLRGDIKTRYDAYHIALQDGWLNRDEVREKENYNAIPDGKGKEYVMNGNMVPIDSAISSKGGDEGEKGNNS